MRIEKDLIGEMEIDDSVYWGIHTQRAINNFNISNYRENRDFIKFYAIVKKASLLANYELEFIEKEKFDAIVEAIDEIIAGKFLDNFPVDPLAGGAGTSTNMNLNEVIANRALVICGRKKGDYSYISPLNHVNLHQSTNDTYPTAVKLTIIYYLKILSDKIASLQNFFQKKEKEFFKILTIGRTQMQQATPVTLGQIFSGFSEAISRDRWRVFKCEERIRQINLGGTSVGTGIAAPTEYIFLATEKLRQLTGFGISRGENLVDQTANQDSILEVSSILKVHAANLIKVCNDLRTLNLTGEIILKPVQSGSSVMPGKVNPVIAESTIQAASRVIANDSMITSFVQNGTLQINEFMPAIAFSIFESLNFLIGANKMLSNAVDEIRCDEKKCRYYFEHSPTIVTSFVPFVGYERAEELFRIVEECKGENIIKILKKELGEQLVEELLTPEKITALGYRKRNKKA